MEDTTLYLLLTKCVPILLYGLDACPVNAADKRSLDFAQSRLLTKTASSDIVQECQSMFGEQRVTNLVLDRKRKFLIKLVDYSNNGVRVAVSGLVRAELDCLN